MKNLKLNLKGLYGYRQSLLSRSPQPRDNREMSERRPREERTLLAPLPQRFARYAAMLIMLLTIGVGQVLAYEYTVYVVPKMLFGNNWTEGSKKVKVWWKTNSGNTEFAQYMSKTDYTYGGNYIYQYKIYSLTGQGADQISFQRFSSSDSWEETYDAFTSWWGQDGFANKIYIGYQSSAHRWMTYCHDATYYFIKTGTSSSWAEAPNAHAWNAAQSTYATTTWPGIRMTDSGKTYKGKNIYSITFNNPPYSMVKFNNYSNNDNQSGEKSLPGNEGKIFDYDADNWLSYHYDHQVTFDGNGSTSGSMTDQTMPYNTATAIKANGFTRTGYTFTGWNTKANGSGAAYAPGANITVTDSDVKLYAQWTQTGYYIVGAFNSWNHPDSCRMTATGTPNEVAVTLRFRAADFSGSSYKTQIKVRDWSTSSGTWYGNNDRSSSKSINKAGNNPTTLTASNSDSYNMYLDLSISAGSYTFRYNTSTKVLTVDFPVNNRIDFFSPSTDYANMTLSAGVYSVEKELTAGSNYTFKLEYLSDFFGDGSSFTTTRTISNLTANSGNMTLTPTRTGTYTFTYNPSTKNFTVTYPTSYSVTVSKGTGITAVSGNVTYAAPGANNPITATVKSGYTWSTWDISGTGASTNSLNASSNPVTANAVVTTANGTFMAVATENKSAITISNTTGGTVTGARAEAYPLGVDTKQAISATADNGYYFKQWNVTGNARVDNSTSSSTNAKADGANEGTGTVTANFVKRWVLRGSREDGETAEGMPLWATTTSAMTVSEGVGTQTVTLYPNRKYKYMIYDKKPTAAQKGCTSSSEASATQPIGTEWTLTGGNPIYFSTKGYGEYTFSVRVGDNDKPAVVISSSPTSYQLTLSWADVNIDGTINKTSRATVGSVTAQTNEGSGFAITNGQYVATGKNITFTAAPATGYTLEGWYTNSDYAADHKINAGGNYAIDGNTLTVSSISADLAIYAKFVETSTAVTIAHNEHGHVEISNATVTSTTVGKTTTRTIKAVPNPGYYFAGWTVPVGADFGVADATEAGNNGSKSTTLRGLGAGTAGTITANFVELEKVYFRNWNEDSKARLWDKVYVYFSISYEKTGDVDCAKSNSSADFYTEMEQIGSTNVYWAYVPRATTRKVNDCDDDIAFSNHAFGTSFKFNNYEAVMRGDYRSNLSMFVPRHASTYTRNGTKYYGGYWKHHDLEIGTYAGYKIERYTGSGYVEPADNGANRRDFIVAGENTIKYTLRVDNLTDDHNRFMIYSDGEKHYITYNSSVVVDGYNITNSICTNVPMSEYNSGSPRFEIEPTSEGFYTLTIDMSSDEMKLSVDYPVAAGDYRLKHTYNDGSAHTTYSDIIKGGVASTTASMYLNTSNSPTFVLEKCTAVSPKIVWTQQGSDLWSAQSGNFNKGKGVYQFDIVIAEGSPSTISSITNAKPYEGNYYIKTDCAPGGWTSYKSNVLDKNTINFDRTSNTFDYYMCRNTRVANKNVKFVIANDYNIAVTDTIDADATYLTGGNKEDVPEACCVRFSYNSVTNDAKRAYLRYSSNDNFLNVIPTGSGKVYSDAGGTSDLNVATDANSKMSEDEGNFVYQKTVYAKSGGAISIRATYNSQNQTFATSPSMITSSNASDVYPIHVVYDFKTNNLTTAWQPGNNPAISAAISDVDYMYIRNGQAAADQLSFSGSGALTDAKVCGAFQFAYDDYVGKVGAWPEQAGQKEGYTNEKCMFYFSFPFNVKVSDIFGIGTYGKEWKIQYYDGEERAKKGFFRGDGTTTFWKDMSLGDTLKAYRGYSLLLDNDYFNTTAEGMVFNGKSAGSSVYLYFPSYQTMSSITSTTKDLTIAPLECKLENTWYDAEMKQTLSHKNTDSHWNMLGVPLLSSHENGDFSSKFTQSGLSYLYEWDPASNALNPAATGSGAGAVGNFTFQAMGAYMVQFTGTITFTGSVPTPSSVAARQKQEEKNYTIDLEVLDAEDTRINHTYVELRDGASDDFMLNEDMYMSPNSKDVNIYSFAGAYDVAANVLSVENHVVPVGVSVKKAGTYKFSMPYEFSGTVTLVDKFNNTRTNLAFDEYEVYLEKGSINDRFDMEINIRKVPTSIENIDGSNALNDGGVHKFIENGQMYILKNGAIYNAQGVKVK